VDRRDCFFEARDFRSYLAALDEMSRQYGVAVHAYVLMTNHVHLLITPSDESSASRMMQQLGRKYVTHFNKAHSRTGTLWEGRFRSSVIKTSRYLFACYRYVELNPVRAGMVKSPEQYEWSSYRSNACARRNEMLRPHCEYLLLGHDTVSRCEKYRRLFVGTHADTDEEIRVACRKGLPL
jgi:putative transposase